MAGITIQGLDGLRSLVGEVLGTSSWIAIDQPDIDAFAASTGDHAWMHVDPGRAAGTPLGSTIAHGLLTLSLGPRCSYEIYAIEGVSLVLNYGFGRVRFPAPVPVGARVRMRAVLVAVDDVAGGATCTIQQTFEREGGDRPVCVAESLLRVQA